MSPSSRRGLPRWFLPTAAAAGVLVIVGFGLTRVAGGTQTTKYTIASAKNVVLNQDAASVEQHNSPTVVANPKNPRQMVVADRIDRPVRSGLLHLSSDAGETWSDVALKLPPGNQPGFAPEVGFDPKGRLFVVFSTIPPAGAHPSGVWLETSDDGGRTLGDPTRVLGAFAFQPRLAVSSADGRLLLTWLQADAASAPASCLPCFSKTGLPVMAATSSDAGKTWSAPVRVSDPARARVGAATPAFGSGGAAYVLYEDFGEDRADWEYTDDAPFTGNFSLIVAKSTDAGATFGAGTAVDDKVRTLERFLVFFPRYPSLAVTPAGELYVAWQDARNGDFDVLLRRSADGGRTWNGPIRVNSDPLRNGRNQYLPMLSASVPGRVDLVYYDRRDDPRNVLVGAYFATSFDRGDHWESVPASDQLFDSRIGPGSERRNPDPGSHLGILSTPAGAWVAWTDTRRGSLDTDKQDLFGARIVIARKR